MIKSQQESTDNRGPTGSQRTSLPRDSILCPLVDAESLKTRSVTKEKHIHREPTAARKSPAAKISAATATGSPRPSHVALGQTRHSAGAHPPGPSSSSAPGRRVAKRLWRPNSIWPTYAIDKRPTVRQVVITISLTYTHSISPAHATGTYTYLSCQHVTSSAERLMKRSSPPAPKHGVTDARTSHVNSPFAPGATPASGDPALPHAP